MTAEDFLKRDGKIRMVRNSSRPIGMQMSFKQKAINSYIMSSCQIS